MMVGSRKPSVRLSRSAGEKLSAATRAAAELAAGRAVHVERRKHDDVLVNGVSEQ